MDDPTIDPNADPPVFDSTEVQDTVTVVGHQTDWNTILWWVVAVGVGYYLLKEAKLT